MRKILPLLPLLLLVSCSDPGSSSSSSELPSSSESVPLSEEEQIEAFLNTIESYPRNVASIAFDGVVKTGFNLSVSPIEISGTQEGVKEYYASSSVGRLLLTEGIETIEGDSPIHFTEQCYVLNNKIYSLRVDKETNDKYKEQDVYSPAYHDSVFDLSFYAEQEANLKAYASFLGAKDVEAKSSIPEIEGDGSYELSYALTLFTYEGYPDQKVSYSYSFKIEDGMISSMKGTLQNDRFLAGKVHESQYSSREVTYTYGELPPYDGEILDPTQFA